MIIVLKKADFSQNNVGHVSIAEASADGLTDEVRAILSNYTRQFTASQKTAIQTFYDGLETNGFTDKFVYLFLPCLASTLNECFIDAKDKYASSVVSPSSNYYVCENGSFRKKLASELEGGLKVTDAAARLSLDMSGLSSKNFQIMSMAATEVTNTHAELYADASLIMPFRALCNNGNTYPNELIGFSYAYAAGTEDGTGYMGSTIKIRGNQVPSSANLRLSGTYLKSKNSVSGFGVIDDYLFVYDSTNKAAQQYDVSAWADADFDADMQITGYNNQNFSRPISAFVFARDLTPKQLNVLSSLLRRLVASVTAS